MANDMSDNTKTVGYGKVASMKSNSSKSARTLNETAFFYPQLATNENGEIVLKFKAPEALDPLENDGVGLHQGPEIRANRENTGDTKRPDGIYQRAAFHARRRLDGIRGQNFEH